MYTKLLTVCVATFGSTSAITKSPRDVCTVIEYRLVGSMTVGGGVVRLSMAVTLHIRGSREGDVLARHASTIRGEPPARHADDFPLGADVYSSDGEHAGTLVHDA